MVNVETKTEELLVVIAEAERAVLEVYNSGDIQVETKSDDSPLTQADLAAHRILISGISKLYPDIPVVSEEGNEYENQQLVTKERFWLVDPLDGTREFIARSGHFTICAALIEEDMPSFGVVNAPALGVTYYGGSALNGAYRITANESPKNIHTQSHVPPIVVASLSNLNHDTGSYIAENYPDSEILRVGSQLKLPKIAEGAADVYPRLGDPLHLWDIAAGHAILEGAGGTMTRFDGSPIDYHNQALKAGDFIAQNH